MLVIAVDIIIEDSIFNPEELGDLVKAAGYNNVELIQLTVKELHPHKFLPHKRLEELQYKLEELQDVKKIIFNSITKSKEFSFFQTGN